jgi:hypothetical protein
VNDILIGAIGVMVLVLAAMVIVFMRRR